MICGIINGMEVSPGPIFIMTIFDQGIILDDQLRSPELLTAANVGKKAKLFQKNKNLKIRKMQPEGRMFVEAPKHQQLSN